MRYRDIEDSRVVIIEEVECPLRIDPVEERFLILIEKRQYVDNLCIASKVAENAPCNGICHQHELKTRGKLFNRGINGGAHEW